MHNVQAVFGYVLLLTSSLNMVCNYTGMPGKLRYTVPGTTNISIIISKEERSGWRHEIGGHRFEPCWWHCVVSLSKTLYSLTSTGSDTGNVPT